MPGQFQTVSAKGNELWTIGKDDNNTIYRFNNNDWQAIPQILSNGSKINGKPISIAAADDGWAWLITTVEPISEGPETYLYRWDAKQKFWENMKTGVFRINAFSRDSAIAETQDLGILAYTNGKWENLPALPEDKDAWSVAIGENGDRWALELVNDLFHWNGSQWNTLAEKPFATGFLDVENSERVIIGAAEGLYVFVPASKNWKQIATSTPGPFYVYAVTINRNSAYYVDAHFNLFTAKI